MKKGIIVIVVVLVLAVSGLLTYFYIDFQLGSQKVDSFLQNSSVNKIKNLGTTKTLEILPLIDWYADRNDLKQEAGVSYIIS
jgi:7,8-dihydropterin-6-yl-methyl-4-(beta-D-ribofuranosyl)aminobenzene 5'-phosphate synthase